MAAADTNTSANRNCKTTKIITAVYSVPFSGNFIETTVTANPSAVDDWIHKFPLTFLPSRLFSMDISVCSLTSKVLTLHFCSGTKCLIIQLDKLSYVPKSLKSFCSNQSYQFAGVNIGDKVRRIKEDYNYGLEFTNQFEIADGDIDIEGKEDLFSSENLSFQMWSLVTAPLMEVYFMKKKKPIQVINGLDLNKVEEAAADAYVAHRIGCILTDSVL